ncbi:MAG: multidrug efflux SMR transporter [Flavipsychrobacter sp.]|nr:multidrug efflux SMR transporter [Flavipsychrobacter sp.]
MLILVAAIICETVATSSLKATEGFTRLVPTIITIAGYLGSLYLLSVTLKTIPVGIAYAIWSGVGIVLVTLFGVFIYQQKPDWPAIIGIALIIAGCVVLNLFSKMQVHD